MRKTCNKCGESKPLTYAYFYKRSDSKDGFRNTCKECRNKSQKEWMKTKPLYQTWQNMIQRCYNQDNPLYQYYGKRGIKVCERWMESYDNFIEDMGERPSENHSIDRIDNDGDYGPSNCRWAENYEQMRNQRVRNTNTSGHTGVYWHSDRNRWHARIKTREKRIDLGYFDNLEDAIEARKQAELKYW